MLHPFRFGAAALAAVIVATVLTAVPVLGADPAGASPRGSVATPATSTSHRWTTDGCSASPERGPGWDFHHACVHHDGCYRNHWTSRRGCDDTFRRDLLASCRWQHGSSWRRWSCDVLARAYHLAVRLFGARAYARGAVTAPVR